MPQITQIFIYQLIVTKLGVTKKVVIRMDSPPWKGGVPVGRGG